jgi:hypothetical protein
VTPALIAPPEIRVRGGSPTADEEEAVRSAILQLWQDARAQAAAASGPSPWVLAARAEATQRDATAVRGARAWRLSGRIAAAPVTTNQIGRGDAK